MNDSSDPPSPPRRPRQQSGASGFIVPPDLVKVAQIVGRHELTIQELERDSVEHDRQLKESKRALHKRIDDIETDTRQVIADTGNLGKIVVRLEVKMAFWAAIGSLVGGLLVGLLMWAFTKQ